MLCLSRKTGQSIVIGPDRDIEVRVLSVHGNVVRLGIEAPKYVPVFRGEVLERLHRREEPAWLRMPLEVGR